MRPAMRSSRSTYTAATRSAADAAAIAAPRGTCAVCCITSADGRRIDLAAARLAWCGGLLPDALRRLRRHFLVAAAFGALAAHAIGRGAQPPADAFSLGLLGLFFSFGFRLARIELAADELDLRDF